MKVESLFEFEGGIDCSVLDDEVYGVFKHVDWQLSLVFFVMRLIRSMV